MKNIEQFKSFIDRREQSDNINYEVCENEPMSRHTTFRVGGPADIFVWPPSVEELCEAIKFCNENGIPYELMGNGSNLLVSDKGIRGVVFATAGRMNNIYLEADDDESRNNARIVAECGALISTISRFAAKNALTGLEFAEGIPGTLGGALAMNAGAYGGEMKQVVLETIAIDATGKRIVLQGDEHQFGYRASVIQSDGLIALQTTMSLRVGNEREIREKMADFAQRRKTKQPLELPSAGSTFRRPEGYFAGKLIQDSGLRGYRVGGAQVSEKHCGFVVNSDGACAKEIMQLINDVKRIVMEKQGIALECEVKLLGEW